jgi:diaminohydroxyphosphoribosylaminopyrimidine deaminase/5-amino-6-(5-phosphoribosylamino)uracil reductase
MRRALRLASAGRGAVEPNPLVGAVVVRNHRLAGEGWHQAYGGPHAEIFALQAAGESARGATLYVTLEPCCHFGKTPPCTHAILAAGIRRVVVAMPDPFPQVAGGGLEELQRAGVAVTLGICRPEAEALNAPYLTLLRLGRPWILAKWAMTLDGRIATRTGDSRWISGEASRARVHQRRGQVDGILIGSGTALADDPALTARPPGPRRATRVILDRRGRLPPNAQVVRTARETPTWILSERPNPAWREAGCEVSALPLRELFAEMGRRRWTNVLVEGGAGILGALLDAELLDEVEVYIAPCLVGGAEAPGPLGGLGVAKLASAWRLHPLVERTGEDIFIRARRFFSPP